MKHETGVLKGRHAILAAVRVAAGGVLAVGSLSWCGCAAMMTDQRSAAMREETRLENLESDVKGLQQRIERIEAAQQDLLSNQRSGSATVGEGEQKARAEMADLARSVKAVETAQGQLKQQIIDELTPKIAEIGDRMRPPSAPAGRTGAGGSEHVVKTGETLSGIAATYKVDVTAIIKANNLSNPNSIRVGQRLVIPE